MTTLYSRFISLFVLFVAVTVLSSLMVFKGISDRKADWLLVNLAGKLSMLALKMTEEAFSLSEGMGDRKTLEGTVTQFNKTFQGLLSGDKDLGFTSTRNADILIRLQEIKGHWGKFARNIEIVNADSEVRNSSLTFIAANNERLLEEIDHAVHMIVEAGLPSRTVNLAGKQRMLTQKITKEVLLAVHGIIPGETVMETVSLFAKNHHGLVKGDGSQGLAAVTDRDILSRLERIESFWVPFRKNVEILVWSSKEMNAALAYLQKHHIPLIEQIDRVTGMYTQTAESKIESLKVVQTAATLIVVVAVFLGWRFIVWPTQENLTESERRFRSLVSNIPGAVYRRSNAPDGSIKYISGAIEEISGFPISYFSQNHVRSYIDIIHQDDRSMVDRLIREGISRKRPFVLEYRIVHSNGEIRWVYEKGQGIFNKKGETLWLDGAIFDVTDSKLAEEELRRAKEQAEEATRMKDQFVSLVAHDLKSPFNSLLGYLDLMISDQQDKLSEKHGKIANRIIESGKGLLDMIDNLLDISRLQTGKITLKPQFIDRYLVAASAKMQLKYIAREKGVGIINQIPKGTRFFADMDLIAEVVQNLISNAVKFCEKGDTVTVFIPKDRETTIAVRDTGVGIPEKILPDLFKHEVKTTTLGTSGEKGTGLGLPFSFDIMKAHEGDLRVESVENEGSTFYATLPFIRPKVLIVEDSKKACDEIKIFLQEFKLDFLETASGEKAIALIDVALSHLFIVDVSLPGMDGFKTLEHIRKNQATKSTPVIVVTGDKNIDTRNKAFQLGANDFITKPFKKEDLVPRVRRFVC